MAPVSTGDQLTWAKTIYGEARGEPHEGRLAVAFVPYNRAQISGRTVAQECLRKLQFSCWNAKDPNRPILLRLQSKDLSDYFLLIDQVLAGILDPSHGATFYHTRAVSPSWSHGETPCARIGHHIFYRDIAPYVLRHS